MGFIAELQQKIAGFCDIIPPGIDSITSFIANLPLVMLWIITLPPRTFFCTLASITQIPIYGLIANLFPPITLFCSLVQGQNTSCFSKCPACTYNNECVQIPQSYINFCQKALPYFSIFDEIFCLLGYVMIVLSLPIITLINIMLLPLGKQICIDVNPNNCIPPGG